MAPVPSFPINVGHIDDVQELRKTKPTQIPRRFVRDNSERPKLATIVPSPNDIPIIDLSKLVVNHWIDPSVVENIEKVAKDFFMLPLEEKHNYPMAPGTVKSYGQAFVFSENQKLDWCNMFALGVKPLCLRNHKLCPSKPANFRYLNEDTVTIISSLELAKFW
ncbi:Detected protein of confused Function [Hibiscus syriacus]|uniref:Detected protein of confused Function n=1 Tax=Hibiscus syriacus TaxID=106335 RepID=A0A6A2XEE5_HIBSY|nr:Detected protein of confused Function [Hibiscus syriacus]